MRLPAHIKRAIKSGPVPKMRDWRSIEDIDQLTLAEKVMMFAETYVHIGEGEHAGEPLKLAKFQEAFIYAVLDNKVHTRQAIFSVGRRAGKTFLTAILGLAALCGPLSKANAVVASAALSREQAGLIFRAMEQIIRQSPDLQAITRIIPSSKRIICLTNSAEYYALSAEAKNNLGRSIYVLILDEAGQIVDPASDFVSMLRTSQGSYSAPYFFTISTQSPNDAAYLSQEIDRAIVESDPETVVHLYAADEDLDLDDPKAWHQANPSIAEGFRSIDDIKKQASTAKAIPAQAAGFMNLILNRRVAQESLWLAPEVWKKNGGQPELGVFQSSMVTIGLDLSKKNDLTVACICAEDDEGVVHVQTHAFTPQRGIEERSRRDRVPYDVWAREGVLTAAPGETIDYEWVAGYLKKYCDDNMIEVGRIEFDRWRIDEMKAASDRVGFASYAEWNAVGQGYASMSPRIEAMETALLQSKIRHGLHPVQNLGASSAIRIQDPAGNSKLDKSKSANKIDAIIALVMGAYPLLAKTEEQLDVMAMIG